MKISANQEHLITSSEDGSIFFMKITEIDKGRDVSNLDPFSGMGDKKFSTNLSKLSNTFALNEFALLNPENEKQMDKKISSLDRVI